MLYYTYVYICIRVTVVEWSLGTATGRFAWPPSWWGTRG